MSYDDIREYLQKLKDSSECRDVRIDWSAIDPEKISAKQAGSMMGLQVADAVASAFFFACELRHGFNEPRYAQMLKPVTYSLKSKHLGFGLKFWPTVTFSDHQHLGWVEGFGQ
jgi:hypothetical protein